RPRSTRPPGAPPEAGRICGRPPPEARAPSHGRGRWGHGRGIQRGFKTSSYSALSSTAESGDMPRTNRHSTRGGTRQPEPAPGLTGLGVAALETEIGLAPLLGVAPAASAALGFVINLMLFLSASWRVHPYFLGSDSIYAAGWAAYFVGVLELRVAQAAWDIRGSRAWIRRT